MMRRDRQKALISLRGRSADLFASFAQLPQEKYLSAGTPSRLIQDYPRENLPPACFEILHRRKNRRFLQLSVTKVENSSRSYKMKKYKKFFTIYLFLFHIVIINIFIVYIYILLHFLHVFCNFRRDIITRYTFYFLDLLCLICISNTSSCSWDLCPKHDKVSHEHEIARSRNNKAKTNFCFKQRDVYTRPKKHTRCVPNARFVSAINLRR